MRRVKERSRAQRVCLVVVWLTVMMMMPPAAMASKPSPEAAIEEAFAPGGDPALVALSQRGARPLRLLVAERLAQGELVVEVALSWQDQVIRYPLRLAQRRADGCVQWEVSWSPDEAFGQALLNMTRSGTLPTLGEDAPVWGNIKRLPTMPLILTRRAILTPFGSIDPTPAPSTGVGQRAVSGVEPPSALVSHTERWLDEVLGGDPGAASVDVIADASVSWRDLTRLVFGVASQGIFKIYLVGAREEGLGVLETAAPIFGALPGVERPVPLVVGYYPRARASDGLTGFRISQGKALLRDEGVCDEEMSFCVADTAALNTRLGQLGETMRQKEPGNPAFAMFATEGGVLIGEAVGWLSGIGEGLGIAQRRVFIGYISR